MVTFGHLHTHAYHHCSLDPFAGQALVMPNLWVPSRSSLSPFTWINLSSRLLSVQGPAGSPGHCPAIQGKASNGVHMVRTPPPESWAMSGLYFQWPQNPLTPAATLPGPFYPGPCLPRETGVNFLPPRIPSICLAFTAGRQLANPAVPALL